MKVRPSQLAKILGAIAAVSTIAFLLLRKANPNVYEQSYIAYRNWLFGYATIGLVLLVLCFNFLVEKIKSHADMRGNYISNSECIVDMAASCTASNLAIALFIIYCIEWVSIGIIFGGLMFSVTAQN